MLPEISLNILDIAQNSVRAQASRIDISIHISTCRHEMEVRITDDGCGMDSEQLAAAADPFYTSRTTRKVGLGIPFLKQSAECTGGVFSIESKKGAGTSVYVLYHTDHIDCMPLGDITETILTLVTSCEGIRFRYEYLVDQKGFVMDTAQFREILGEGISFSEPEVRMFIREYLTENKQETDNRIR